MADTYSRKFNKTSKKVKGWDKEEAHKKLTQEWYQNGFPKKKSNYNKMYASGYQLSNANVA